MNCSSKESVCAWPHAIGSFGSVNAAGSTPASIKTLPTNFWQETPAPLTAAFGTNGVPSHEVAALLRTTIRSGV